MNNVNKKISRKRKRRIERRIKIDDKKKALRNKIKSQKKKKNKNFDKYKDLEIELVRFKYANNHNRLQSEMKELNITHFFAKNLREIKNEIFRDYAG